MARRIFRPQPHFFDGLLAGWADCVRRLAWPILVAAVLLSAAALAYSVNAIGMTTSTEKMLSQDLPFLKAQQRYQTIFPQFSGMMVVVVEGENADLAEDGATRLAKRLAASNELFIDVFYPNDLEHFRRNGLLYRDAEALVRMSDRLAGAQPLLAELNADPTLRGLFGVLGEAVNELRNGAGLSDEFERAVRRIAEVTKARAAGQDASLSWIELLDGDPPSPEDRRRLIVTRPWQDFDSLRPAGRAMEAVRAEAAALGLTPENGVDVRLTGPAAIASEELDAVTEGAAVAGVLSLILVTALLVIGLRSARLVLAVLATLVMGLIWTGGFAAAAVGTLNLVSVAFAVLFIGLGVDFGIHYALRYREAVEHGSDPPAALRAASAGAGPSLVLSAVAAAITFLSFVPTDYVGVSELGIIAGAGMFIALIANLTVLPAILTVLPIAAEGGVSVWGLAAMAGERFVRDHHRAILAGAVVVGVAALALVPQARFDTDPLNLKDRSKESVQAAEMLRAASPSPYETIKIVAPSGEAAAALAARVAALDTVRKVVTVNDLVPPNQEERAQIVEDMAFFLEPALLPAPEAAPPSDAERRAAMVALRDRAADAVAADGAKTAAPALEALGGALGAYLADGNDPSRLEGALLGTLPPRLESLETSLHAAPFGIADLPDSLRERYLAPGGQHRLEVYAADHLRGKAGLRKFVDEVQSVAPTATGGPVLELRAGDVIVDAFNQASVIALALVTLMMLVVLGRPTDALLVMAPLALAAALTIATAVLLGLDFNFANIIVMPLLIGLGVASGIQLVVRARHDLRTTVLSSSTPRAVIFSALTTVGSFGSLAVSGHRGTASMGELLMVAISYTLVCTLIVLPALMELRDRRHRKDTA